MGLIIALSVSVCVTHLRVCSCGSERLCSESSLVLWTERDPLPHCLLSQWEGGAEYPCDPLDSLFAMHFSYYLCNELG